MHTRVTACGVVGGALILIAAAVALLAGGADTVTVGAWVRSRQRCSCARPGQPQQRSSRAASDHQQG